MLAAFLWAALGILVVVARRLEIARKANNELARRLAARRW
jgi:hypothetical protein